MGVVRLLIWNVGDSMTSFAELRERVPYVDPPSVWIANEASERFGLIAFDEIPEEVLAEVSALIGKQPEIGEEFDVEE
ncbi:MAG: hypothetical protein ACR2MU_07250 [Gaiellaceae bacterium]